MIYEVYVYHCSQCNFYVVHCQQYCKKVSKVLTGVCTCSVDNSVYRSLCLLRPIYIIHAPLKEVGDSDWLLLTEAAATWLF